MRRELTWAEIKKHYFFHNLINDWLIRKVIYGLKKGEVDV